MRNLQLLVVDDDDLILQTLRMTVPAPWAVTGVNAPNEVPNRSFNAAFVDMHLTGNLAHAEGIDVIKKLRTQHAHLEIVAISGNLDRQLMEQCLKAGATRFLAKPLSSDEVALTLEKIEALILLQEATLRSTTPQYRWVGSGQKSRDIQRQMAQLRGEKGPILIEGESGCGKEVVTQILHAQEENSGPLIPVNVAAIPENLFESEFFGHIKGAFTGADQNKMGLAEAAQGGALFLDEIEAMPLAMQAKLLRFLESGELRRVGARDAIVISTRVIVATNRNLSQLAQEGRFREDLLWRLSGKKILLPPLRERRDDIEELVKYFLGFDHVRRKSLDPEALEVMLSYDWPGNVRELKRVCEQLLLSTPLPIIRREDVSRIISPARSSNSHVLSQIDWGQGLVKLVEHYEADLIKRCLEAQKDIDETARTLQISRSSLYKKIKDYNIEWKDL